MWKNMKNVQTRKLQRINDVQFHRRRQGEKTRKGNKRRGGGCMVNVGELLRNTTQIDFCRINNKPHTYANTQIHRKPQRAL